MDWSAAAARHRAVLGNSAAPGDGFAAGGIVYATATLTGAGVLTAAGFVPAVLPPVIGGLVRRRTGAAAKLGPADRPAGGEAGAFLPLRPVTGGLVRRRPHARAVVGNNGAAGGGVAAPATIVGTASLTGAGVLTAAAIVTAAAVTSGRVYQRHVTAARLVFRGLTAPPLPVAAPRPPPQRARLRLARAVTGPRATSGSGFAAPSTFPGTASLTGAGALTASGTPQAPPATGGRVYRRATAPTAAPPPVPAAGYGPGSPPRSPQPRPRR